MYMAPYSKWRRWWKSTLYHDHEIARSIFTIFAPIAFIQEDHDISSKSSFYRSFSAIISHSILNQSESTGNGIRQINNKVEDSLQREGRLDDVKIDTLHMRTTQQTNRDI
ncbi:hypothetical protein HZS_4137 [Henneguya salminicola]|nr:hypothetical protein HZS_4137 [Henneguya salminicola]